MNFKIITLVLIIASSIGCAGNVKTDPTLFDSFSPAPLADFRVRGSSGFTINENVGMMAVSLLRVPQKVFINIRLPWEINRILHVKVIEGERINVHRHLLDGQEFMFNKNGRNLMILLDLPLIYFFDGHITFDLQVLGLSTSSYTKKINKRVSFNWMPKLKGEYGKTGFSYAAPHQGQKKLVDYPWIIEQVRLELKRANIARFSSSYRKKIQEFVK
ncbi:MAG: hypothetical protein KAW12_04640 [Candidatus Aminicenantes bacterium]|nr:hypothetical protein [Candidatus Aminicenantes bacterium]